MNSSRERSGGWWESPKQGHQAQPGVGPGGCPEQVGTPANLGETRRKTPNSDKGDVTTVAGSVSVAVLTPADARHWPEEKPFFSELSPVCVQKAESD